jgi:hypothetical protein
MSIEEVTYPDYFNDENLRLAIAGRAAAEFEMRMYMKKASSEHRGLIESIQKASQKRDHESRAIHLSKYYDFNHKLKLNAEKMMYPGDI